jgi:hypothetical protein
VMRMEEPPSLARTSASSRVQYCARAFGTSGVLGYFVARAFIFTASSGAIMECAK